ncbi:MAG: PQQ-binding-like beta-propeller repeat protein, partial [Planctomycetota bacterium]|nr:PQQ-binding-like beta-propeller repeat protein [Planctomycetota bacterium]
MMLPGRWSHGCVRLSLMALAAWLAAASVSHEALGGAKEDAQAILRATGVRGGLVVHLAAGKDVSPDLTAALHATDAYLVHGLYSGAGAVERARKQMRADGLYGKVTVARLRGGRLPYAEGTVRLLVADDLGPVARNEVMRVLCPGGVSYVGGPGLRSLGEGGKKTVKPVPAQIDEWTHGLHDASNNAVSHDTVVAPPHHLQWVGGPAWARSHDHLSSCSVVVSSAGRVFAIIDEGPTAAVALPSKWRLVARDAFSGVVLWKRAVDPWEGHLRGFRTGPAAIMRRLVAVGDTVYATLGYGKPVTALDAATGKTLRTYAKTDDALEIVCADGVLYVVLGPGLSHGAAKTKHENVGRVEYVSPDGKRLMAVEARSGKVLWTKDDADTRHCMPTALAVADGQLFFQNAKHLVCLDAATGRERWRADRPVTANRWAWSAPTLVVHDGVVLSADRAAGSKVGSDVGEGKVLWVVYARGGEAPPGKLIAFSTKDGKRLWESKAREAYNSPVNVFVVDNLVWTGILVSGREPGITQALDLMTGAVRRTRPKDQEFFSVGFVHHRCYRDKATDRFLVLGRSGVEWIDVKTGEGTADHWVRGACQYGVMPCNGLLYAPSHPCACYIEAKLNGFVALAPASASRRLPEKIPAEGRLEKGPAYGQAIRNPKSEIRNDDWPTYRHDAARTGRASSKVPTNLAQAWQTDLGGELTSPVVAGGRV